MTADNTATCEIAGGHRPPLQWPSRTFCAKPIRVEKSRNMILEELYDALIEAGSSQEKARAASRAVADMEGHFAKIEKGLSELRSDVGHEILALRSHVDHEITALRFTPS